MIPLDPSTATATPDVSFSQDAIGTNTTLLVVVAIIAVAVIIGIVILATRTHSTDTVLIISAITTFAGGVLAALYAQLRSVSDKVSAVAGRLTQIDVKVDGRLSELLKETRRSQLAEGRLQGVADEQARLSEHAKSTADAASAVLATASEAKAAINAHDAWERDELAKNVAALAENTRLTLAVHDAVVAPSGKDQKS
jgi:hypothetical protein